MSARSEWTSMVAASPQTDAAGSPGQDSTGLAALPHAALGVPGAKRGAASSLSQAGTATARSARSPTVTLVRDIRAQFGALRGGLLRAVGDRTARSSVTSAMRVASLARR
jgi:hypothetical protein